MAAGRVPEAAEPGLRAQHLRRRLAVEQLDRRAKRRPFLHPLLRDLEAAGRMDGLHPAGLLGLGGDVVLAHEVEEILRGVAQHAVEPLAGLAVARRHAGGVMAGQRRDHLAVVAARCAPARLHRLHHRDGDAHLAQVDGGRQTREARTDDDDIRRLLADERLQHRAGRRRGDPQGRRPGSRGSGRHGGISGHVARSMKAPCRVSGKPPAGGGAPQETKTTGSFCRQGLDLEYSSYLYAQ